MLPETCPLYPWRDILKALHLGTVFDSDFSWGLRAFWRRPGSGWLSCNRRLPFAKSRTHASFYCTCNTRQGVPLVSGNEQSKGDVDEENRALMFVLDNEKEVRTKMPRRFELSCQGIPTSKTTQISPHWLHLLCKMHFCFAQRPVLLALEEIYWYLVRRSP